jgi:hypothetical protein
MATHSVRSRHEASSVQPDDSYGFLIGHRSRLCHLRSPVAEEEVVRFSRLRARVDVSCGRRVSDT